MAAQTEDWITKNDLIVAFGERDLPIDDQGLVSEEKISESIESATLYVESYLRAVEVALPASDSIQDQLKDVMLDITRYKYSNNEAAMTEEIRNRYNDAISYLNKILKGSVQLIDGDNDPAAPKAGWSTMTIWRTN